MVVPLHSKEILSFLKLNEHYSFRSKLLKLEKKNFAIKQPISDMVASNKKLKSIF